MNVGELKKILAEFPDETLVLSITHSGFVSPDVITVYHGGPNGNLYQRRTAYGIGSHLGLLIEIDAYEEMRMLRRRF